MFIKLGVEGLEPSVVVLGRLVVGVAVLLPFLAGRGGLGVLREAAVPVLVLAALNNALPFWLLGFAETHLDSGLTAVIQAAAPIVTVLLAARIDASQMTPATSAASAFATRSRPIGICVLLEHGAPDFPDRLFED